MRRPRAILMLAASALAAPLLALGVAAPAQAADELQLSMDGTTWSTSLPGAIFPAGQSLVPGSRINGTFFLRNASAAPAWVRVGVSDLTVTSTDFAAALNLSAVGTTSDGASGASSKVGAADIICSDFLNRTTPLPPGGIVRIDASMWFRPDVTGTRAQNEAAQVAFIAELSDVDLNALGWPLCANLPVIGPGDPTGGGGGTSGGGSGTTGGSGSGMGINGNASPGSLNGSAISSLSGGSFEFGWGGPRPFAELDPDMGFNTVQWWEEYAIFVLLGAALAGALARIYVQRRWVMVDRRTGESKWQGSERPSRAAVKRASGPISRPASAQVFSSSSSASPLR